MPVLIYEGRVEPDVVPLTIDYQPRFIRQETESAPEARYEITVFVGRVRVMVETKHVDEQIGHDLYFVAWDQARMFVQTAGFIRAIPYSVTLDRVVFPDGSSKQFALGDRSLAETHDFNDDDIELLSDMTLVDLKCGLLLSDILMTLGQAHYSPTACGRVADSIARLISPAAGRSQQWAALHQALRVDEAFVKSLTEVSKASRHGDREEVSAVKNHETAHRAWTLVGRYLRYRKNGSLDPLHYPVLAG